MDEIIFNLFKFMKENLGTLGFSILAREMKNINHDSKNPLTDSEKDILVERMMDSFYENSISKRGMIKSKLFSLMKYSNNRVTNVNNDSAIEFLMGKPN